jgi:GTPase SAR1 family protein
VNFSVVSLPFLVAFQYGHSVAEFLRNGSAGANKEGIMDLIKFSVMRKIIHDKKTMPWNRSKIILLGQGRAGKTALAHNIQGLQFEENSPSTLGTKKFDLRMLSDPEILDVHSSDGGIVKGRFVKHEGLQSITDEALRSSFHKYDGLKRKYDQLVSEGEDVSGHKVEDPEIKQKSVKYGTGPDLADAKINLETSSNINIQRTENLTTPERKFINKNDSVAVIPASVSDSSFNRDFSGGHSEDVGSVNEEVYDIEELGRKWSDNIRQNSTFIISLYDFGGQDIFHVFHSFFMSRNAVYFLVFDLSLLLSRDEEKVRFCLAQVKLWLNSIVLHTLLKKVQPTGESGEETTKTKIHLDISPIALVGTKADLEYVIHDRSRLLQASKMLKDAFSHHLAWSFLMKFSMKSVGKGGGTLLNFFPIDKKGRTDLSKIALEQLITLSEEAMTNFTELREEKPLTWFKTTDAILREKEKGSFIEYNDARKIAESNGVFNDFQFDLMLKFLSESGLLLWVDDVNSPLRDIAILDPTEYFIKPATRIICKHLPTVGDKTVHSCRAIHQACRETWPREWVRMLEYGFVSTELTAKLLFDNYTCCRNEDHYKRVLYLLKKFGLLLPCKIPPALQLNDKEPADSEIYFFPSLSPVNPKDYDVACVDDEKNTLQNMMKRLQIKYLWLSESFQSVETFYFAFTFSDLITNVPLLSKEDVATHGFLPNGLFDRFVGKLFEGMSTASDNLGDLFNRSSFIGFKDRVVLNYLNLELRITNIWDSNLIQVDVASFKKDDLAYDKQLPFEEIRESPLVEETEVSNRENNTFDGEDEDGLLVLLLDTLYTKITSLLESIDNLKVIALLPYDRNAPSCDTSPLLPFNELRFIVKKRLTHVRYLSIDGQRQINNVHWRDLKMSFSKFLEIESIHPEKNQVNKEVGIMHLSFLF